MFRTLSYSVTFPSTGRTLSADLDFDPGYYAITGSNESGKTMILEMLRFSLFGTIALRGAADDYKSLSVTSSFVIKGLEYEVERTMKAATLKREGEIIASGVTTVNEKIGQILGFGLPVFDVACSINQGEVERLGSMTPGERKRLVDSVLGIDALDVVAKWGMEEARLLDKEAETIRRGLVVPVNPEAPADYVPSESIDLDALRADARELAELNGFLSQTRTCPIKPTEPTSLSVQDLEPLAAQQASNRSLIAKLKAEIAARPSVAPEIPDDIDEQWEAYGRYSEAQAWLKAHPNQEHERQICIDYLEQYEVLDEQKRIAAEISRLEAEIQRHEDGPTHTCSSCGHEDLLGQDHVDQLRAQLRSIDQVVPSFDPTEYSRSSLEAALRAWEGFDDKTFQQMKAVPAAERPSIEKHMIPVLRAQIVQSVEREVMEAELDTLTYDPEPEELLAKRKAYETALASYETAIAEFQDWKVKADAATARRAQLEGADEKLYRAQRQHADAVDYERELSRFAEAVERYNNGVAEADDLEASAKEHRKVRELMAVLRSLIKQHLMPSLNKVSSYLLQEMTGGQRNAVYVDENFNVTVDNQRLETLSGSGKACTNLAIRIALGQVLTNKVFSVLLADEIDASMDDFRAQNTSQVLDTLRNNICQILLVSHKSIEATNVIRLGSSIETEQGSEGAL